MHNYTDRTINYPKDGERRKKSAKYVETQLKTAKDKERRTNYVVCTGLVGASRKSPCLVIIIIIITSHTVWSFCLLDTSPAGDFAYETCLLESLPIVEQFAY